MKEVFNGEINSDHIVEALQKVQAALVEAVGRYNDSTIDRSERQRGIEREQIHSLEIRRRELADSLVEWNMAGIRPTKAVSDSVESYQRAVIESAEAVIREFDRLGLRHYVHTQLGAAIEAMRANIGLLEERQKNGAFANTPPPVEAEIGLIEPAPKDRRFEYIPPPPLTDAELQRLEPSRKDFERMNHQALIEMYFGQLVAAIIAKGSMLRGEDYAHCRAEAIRMANFITLPEAETSKRT